MIGLHDHHRVHITRVARISRSLPRRRLDAHPAPARLLSRILLTRTILLAPPNLPSQPARPPSCSPCRQPTSLDLAHEVIKAVAFQSGDDIGLRIAARPQGDVVTSLAFDVASAVWT
jgi:hypothetical protein